MLRHPLREKDPLAVKQCLSVVYLRILKVNFQDLLLQLLITILSENTQTFSFGILSLAHRILFIFINSLCINFTEEIIREIFAFCGEITNIRLSNKKFCHIRFAEENAVDQALTLSGWLDSSVDRVTR